MRTEAKCQGKKRMVTLGGRSFGNERPSQQTVRGTKSACVLLQGLCLGSAAGLRCRAELPHLQLTPIQELQSAGREELPNVQDSSSKQIACHPNVKQPLSFRS